MNRKTHVLGVPFDVVTMDEAVARAEGLLKEKGQHFICTPNPEIVMEARKDAELMSILREADLVVPDGIGVVWASKYSEIRERGNLLFLWRRARSCGNGGKKNDEEIPRTEDCGRA